MGKEKERIKMSAHSKQKPTKGKDMEISFAKLEIHLLTGPENRALCSGQSCSFYLEKLGRHGATDTSFNIGGSGAGDLVYGVAVKPDGNIVIGGALLSVNGQSIQRVSTLNTNGAPDVSFTQAVNNIVRAVAVQPDGKVLIAGDFTTVAGVSSPYSLDSQQTEHWTLWLRPL